MLTPLHHFVIAINMAFTGCVKHPALHAQCLDHFECTALCVLLGVNTLGPLVPFGTDLCSFSGPGLHKTLCYYAWFILTKQQYLQNSRQYINERAVFLLPQKDAGVIKKKQQNVSPNSRSCLLLANLICLLSAAPCQRFCFLQRAYGSLKGGRNVGSLSAIRGCVGGSGWGASGTA